MAKRKNNLQKAFDQHAKMSLRDLPHMKNGGRAPSAYQENAAIPEVQALMGTDKPRPTLTDTISLRAAQPAIPPAANVAPPPSLPAQAPEPSLLQRVRARMKMANGGEVTDKQALAGSTPQTGGVLQQLGTFMAPAMPQPMAEPAPMPLNTIPATAPGKLPVISGRPVITEGVPPIRTAINGVRAADGGLVDRHGLRAAMRAGETGRVVGKGGPREDKVPAMLSNGEYVLPAKTAEAMGGPEALDEIVRATNDGREPAVSLRSGAHLANGLVPYDPVVGQAPGPVVETPPVRITRAPNPNVDPVMGSAEMRDFMANNPRAPGGGSPLPDVTPANATSLASKGLRFVARATPAAAVGAGLTGAVQSVAEPFTNRDKVSGYASSVGLGAEQGDSPLWQHAKETAAQGLRVFQNIGDATGAGYLGRAIARKLGGENFFDFGGSATPASPAAPAATPARAAPAAPVAPAAPAAPPEDEVITRPLFNPEQRASLRAAQYAPTQYRDDPTTTPSLRRDDLHAGADFAGSGGINNPKSWDWLVTRKDRRMAQEAASNEANNATLRRGQDMRFAGDAAQAAAMTRKAELDSASDARKAERDQSNKDREFKAQQEKQAAEEGRAQQTARAQASEAQRKEIESRFRMRDADGKDIPDTAKASQYYAAAAKTLPAMIAALKAQGSPAALAKANELTEKGIGALEPGDHDELMNLFNRRERMAQAAGMGPNQGTYQHSDNLLDYRQVEGPNGVEKRVFGGNRINTAAGSVSVNDLRYKDGPANPLLPDWFKTKDRDLTRGLRME